MIPSTLELQSHFLCSPLCSYYTKLHTLTLELWTWPPSCLLHNGCTKIFWTVTEGVTNNCEKDSETVVQTQNPIRFWLKLNLTAALLRDNGRRYKKCRRWKSVQRFSTPFVIEKKTKTLWLFVTSLHKYCSSHSNLEKSQLCNVSFPRFCKLFGIQLEPFEPSSAQSEERPYRENAHKNPRSSSPLADTGFHFAVGLLLLWPVKEEKGCIKNCWKLNVCIFP